MSITIREIKQNELQELYALRQCVLRIPLGLNLFDEDLVAETDWKKFGAYSNNRLVGCVMLTHISNTKIKLRQMCVYPHVQGQSIGSLLVQHAEDWCYRNNYTIVQLHARDFAKGFYEKLHYKQVGECFLEVGIEHYKMIKKLG